MMESSLGEFDVDGDTETTSNAYDPSRGRVHA